MQNERTTNENQCQEHRDVKYVAQSNGDKQTLESFNDDYDNEDEVGSGDRSRAPIDHGWAWMVVLGSFGVFAVVIGILKSFGVLLVELSRKYDAPASLLSSSQSLCSCLHMSVGLVSNALSVRFGHRKIVFLGGVLTAAGLISTAFVTSIEWFFVTYGLITGFGLGMCMSPSLVVFGMFFRRRLALANGLASSGSGLGSFVFPYLMLYLLDEYSIGGCMLILGGIALHICVFATFFRPLSFWRNRPHFEGSPKLKCDTPDVSITSAERKLFLNEANSGKSDLNDSRRISTSLPCIDITVTPVRERASTFSHQSQIHLLTTNRYAAKAMLYASIESLPYFSELSQERTSCHAEEQYVNDEVKSTRKLVNWDLLKNPKFHMIVWGLFCALYGHHSLFTIIPSLAVEFGFSDRQGTVAVSVVGICDLIGRIGTGVLSNNISWRRISVFRLSLLVFAITNMVLAFADGFIVFVALCAVLGITTGGYIGLQMAILVEGLGLNNLSSAWGYAAVFISSSLLVNPLIAGVTKDATNTWTTSIKLSSAVSFLGVLTLSSDYIFRVINRILN